MMDVKVFLKRQSSAAYGKQDGKEDIPEELIKTICNYVNIRIAALINGAPAALDTLGEIADAMKEHSDVLETLDLAIGSKANKSDLTNYVLAEELRPMTSDEVAAMIAAAKGE